jgi:hypothetical protein
MVSKSGRWWYSEIIGWIHRVWQLTNINFLVALVKHIAKRDRAEKWDLRNGLLVGLIKIAIHANTRRVEILHED